MCLKAAFSARAISLATSSSIPSVFLGDPVHVLEFPDVVSAHPSVLPRCGIACHAALIITSEQSLDIELEEAALFLLRTQKRLRQVLLPTDHP